MKNEAEIQRAHDLLHAVLEYDAQQPGKMPRKLNAPMMSAHDVLSWVLDGACKGPFADNIKMLEQKMRKGGYHFVKREWKGHSE